MQVFAYTAYLVWSALTSEPVPATCIREMGRGNTAIKVHPASDSWAAHVGMLPHPPCCKAPGKLRA